MNLYARYLKEREGIETLEVEHGFATFLLRSTDCYIIDIYVVPELRQSGLAKQLADQIAEIAKSQGIKLLTGSVDSRDPQAKRNEAVLVAYGMRKVREDNFMTYYLKEIT